MTGATFSIKILSSLWFSLIINTYTWRQSICKLRQLNEQIYANIIYWAKGLTDHPKNCDNVFVVQYFGMNFGTFNENTIWHQSCASAGIWHSACSLRLRKHTKPLKCTRNSRNDLKRNSNHRNLKNTVFALKWH